MQFGRYNFLCTISSETILPPYKGSTFRGAFGSAMKSVVCALRQQNCHNCILAANCVYALTFEQNSPAVGRHTRMAAPPHPYVIQPPTTSRTRFKKGDNFTFTLLLFGEANKQIPYFIYAFKAMGERGLGKRINGRRGAYELKSVTSADQEIYSLDRQTLIPIQPENITLNNPQAPGTGELLVQLKTPLRLKFANNLQADLPFNLLTRALLRRISSLFACYGSGEPDIDYRGLVRQAGEIKLAKDELLWFDWKRYSNRQERSMLMGGMVGSAVYTGDFSNFIPLLELGRKFHIGKQTSFGLGQFAYTFRELP